MSIESNLQKVCERVRRVKRFDEGVAPVQIVAVSKGRSAEQISQYLDLLDSSPTLKEIVTGGGQELPILGENYVQEFSEKITHLDPTRFQAHFIGRLQRNKVRSALDVFETVESVASESLISSLKREAERRSKIIPVFLQVNISLDNAKAGFSAVEVSERFAAWKSELAGKLKVVGLMTITEQYPSVEAVRTDFKALRQLRDSLDPHLQLSMGMSADFEIAIEEGATHVRIGSAIFGDR